MSKLNCFRPAQIALECFTDVEPILATYQVKYFHVNRQLPGEEVGLIPGNF
ncbi:hypothetical protein [Virgibacillus halodenitrificans]|uniref:hypothetical protein n=1 Tax=Virgibacillus halodenitrificans TaxID=1482 RepID=UPI0012FD470B|nr:hypothetical protein [Virgibacillus halodenitrificans]